MDEANQLVLDAIQSELLDPQVVEVAVRHALKVIAEQTANEGARLTDATAAVARLDGEIRRLTAAIASGGDIDALVVALRERQKLAPVHSGTSSASSGSGR